MLRRQTSYRDKVLELSYPCAAAGVLCGSSLPTSTVGLARRAFPWNTCGHSGRTGSVLSQMISSCSSCALYDMYRKVSISIHIYMYVYSLPASKPERRTCSHILFQYIPVPQALQKPVGITVIYLLSEDNNLTSTLRQQELRKVPVYLHIVIQ